MNAERKNTKWIWLLVAGLVVGIIIIVAIVSAERVLFSDPSRKDLAVEWRTEWRDVKGPLYLEGSITNQTTNLFPYVILRYTKTDSSDFSWKKSELYLDLKPFERREFSIYADHRLIKVTRVEVAHISSLAEWK